MKILAVILFLAPLCVLAQVPVETRCFVEDPGLPPRERLVDMTHMRLKVEFEPEKGLVKGDVTHFFTPLRKTVDSVFLDAPGIQVKKALLNGKPVKYTSGAEGISFYPGVPLSWGEKDSLRIVYEASPRKGIYFIGWNDSKNISRKQIWTQGQGIDNRHWFPSFDSQNDKLTTEVIVSFDAQYEVLSNGNLISKKQGGDQIIWHYRMSKPHTTYLVMLGIGDYKIRNTKSKSGVPMAAWYYPEYEDRVEATYRYSEQMMDFFEEELGTPYPWETYSQIPVQDFMYGAMENTTATLFGDFYLVDENSYQDKNYVATNAHELAHQWFGDYVTARSPAHHWLQESFATYYSLLFDREVFGQDYFDWQRREDHQISLNAGRQDILPIAHSHAGTARWYPKGSSVLGMLSYVLGEEQYRKGITHYLKKHPYENVDSDDLLTAFHESLGVSMDWFWNQWVYRGGEPEYNVSWTVFTDDKGLKKGRFNVDQVQNTGGVLPLFKMPFVFEVWYKNGSKDSVRVMLSDRNEVVEIPLAAGKEVAFPLFDPGSMVLKQVAFQKSREQLEFQSTMAENVLDRYDAVKQLGTHNLDSNKELYSRILKSDEFYAVKGEIMNQAGQAGKEGYPILETGLKDKDIQVKRSAISAMDKVPAELKKDVEALLGNSTYEISAQALRKLGEQYPDEIDDFVKKTDGRTGTRGNNLLIQSLELQALKDTSAVARLVEMTSHSYEFITRTNAMQALKRLNHLDISFLENLIAASFSANSRLAGPARQVLKYFAGQNEFRSLIYNYVRSIRYTEEQKRVIEEILG